ncbi:MAG: serine hydrolase domain-containing protein [Pirellula sp.]
MYGKRRIFLGLLIGGVALGEQLMASIDMDAWDDAIRVLDHATASGQVRGASIFARIGKDVLSRAFGTADTTQKSFLLGSISKPISIAAFMTLYDRGKFDLNDPVSKYIPEFQGDGREKVLVKHLLTHVSGLPDQLPENAALRSSHSSLGKFAEGAWRVPLKFVPGTKYEYSSMAIMLAAEMAQRLSGVEFKEFVDRTVLQPLEMTRSAVGMGRLRDDDVMSCQVEFGAIEAGGGSPDSKSWDWNSSYWRQLGAPWGGVHASAEDIAKFLQEFMHPTGKFLKKEVAKMMVQNHNPAHLPSRGLGFDVGLNEFCTPCTEQTFGHSGSTGTLAWADPARDRLCVVLTTLPATAVTPHPRQLASDCISNAS